MKLHDQIEYKQNCATSKKTFENKKSEYVIRFARTINFNTNTSYVWEKIKIIKNSWCKAKANCQKSKEDHDKKCTECLNNFSRHVNKMISLLNPFRLPK
ncbi:hypothetical protein TSAR_012364 [Trichomalopsis sarcophagae]|uniref:Uncharacterized protein n=1 Tax=Trichomalopsis sarcophagae TaxID=543379 RepID=A0A232EDQ7_9HYME|nr:hypothetical protein TSAR_012364 [Trichomalopsis sarcophagae]